MKTKGFHVTGKENLTEINDVGLLGSEWPSDNNFKTSISDPFTLHADGAVFCFPTLHQAEQEQEYWDNGHGIAILKIQGDGVTFQHYAEGKQIAIRANTATWEVVQ